MINTHVDVIKEGAVINVPFTSADVAALQAILLKSLNHQVKIDDASWNTIEGLCLRVDQCAKDQNLTHSHEISF
jgi:hypothetical protein